MTEPSVPAEVLPSEEEADRITEALKAAVEVAGAAVGEVERLALIARDRGVWKVKGYDSWNAYAEAEIGWSKRHANRMIRYAKFAGELAAAGGTMVPVPPEGQTRNLTDEQRAEVVAEVKEATAGLPKKQREKVATEVVKKATRNFEARQLTLNLTDTESSKLTASAVAVHDQSDALAGKLLSVAIDLASILVAAGVTDPVEFLGRTVRELLETGEVPSFPANGAGSSRAAKFAANRPPQVPVRPINVAQSLRRDEVTPAFKERKK